jgi:c-di-GMP-binding flagellar brake protein YcgR
MSNERRHHPRINTSLGAEVINRNGETFDATVTDLSTGGLTLEGEVSLKKHIEVVDVETGEPVFPIEVSVIFNLQLDNTPRQFKITCRLVHKHRLAQNTYKLGMRILSIDEGESNLLTRYIETSGKS